MAARAARRDVVVTENPLVRLVILFGSLSLVALGGGTSVLPAMHREAVDAQLGLRQRLVLSALIAGVSMWIRVVDAVP